jgi:hypothetical protein
MLFLKSIMKITPLHFLMQFVDGFVKNYNTLSIAFLTSSSGGSEDATSESDESGRLKVAVVAVAMGITFNFGVSDVGKARFTSLETNARYFPKGYGRSLDSEMVSEPRANEAVVFDDFFTTGLRLPPHPVLADILQKFWVQLHQLTPNAIVQIGKFIWIVISYGGRPTVDVFTWHYELHYQQKKIWLEGSENTLAAQFGCITFHPSCYGGRAKLTPAMKNKWTSGWARNLLYCKVPLQ